MKKIDYNLTKFSFSIFSLINEPHLALHAAIHSSTERSTERRYDIRGLREF